MYNPTPWKDHVTNPSNCFNITKNEDGTYQITRAGTVMQQGTPQDAAHFTNQEDGIWELFACYGLLLNYARQMGWDVERGSINLTNTAKPYPFNNSQKTVALQELCAPYYARYMDDMGAIIEGKAAAWELVEEVDNYLQTNLGLNLNQKTAVIPIGNPVEFVGRKISPVKIELRRQTTLGMKKHLRYVQDAYAAGEIDLDYALSVITSYRGLFKDVTSDAFLEKMLDEFVLSRPALEA